MNGVTIVRSDTTGMSAHALAITQEAAEIVIVGQKTLDQAAAFLQRILQFRGTVDDKFKGPVAHAYKAHRSMKALMNEIDKPAKDAWVLVKDKIADFQMEQEVIRRKEQDRLREAARKQAEDKQLADAEQLEKDGHKDAAEEVLAAPTMSVAPIIVADVPKAKGLSIRRLWKARIVDENAIPRQWLIPNVKGIDAHARNMGTQARIAGVEFYETIIPAVRARE